MNFINAAGTAVDLLSRVPWQAAYDRAIKLRAGASQQSAAYVVSALNSVLPPDRRRWTPESLAAFIIAFANVVEDESNENGVKVVALRAPQQIVDYLLLGTVVDSATRDSLNAMLLRECLDVFETLHYVNKYVREQETLREVEAQPMDGSPRQDLGDAEPAEHSPSGRKAIGWSPALSVAVKIWQAGDAVVAKTTGRVAAKRRKLLEGRIAKIHAKALKVGGLSTRECRDVLKLHNLSDDDIDGALNASTEDDSAQAGKDQA